MVFDPSTTCWLVVISASATLPPGHAWLANGAVLPSSRKGCTVLLSGLSIGSALLSAGMDPVAAAIDEMFSGSAMYSRNARAVAGFFALALTTR